MKHHGFCLRAAAATAGMALLLVGGTGTAALAAVAAVAATPAPAAPGAPTGLTGTPGDGPSATVTVTPVASGGSSSRNSGAGNSQDPGSVPGAPVSLATSYGDGFIALSWSAPASAGSSAITGYRVYVGTSPSFASFKEYTTSGPSFRTTAVENGSTYFIKVTAVNAAGEGPATSVAQVTPVPRAGPAAPTGLTAQGRRGEVILSWSPPPGGLAAGDGYLIYMGTSPGGEGAKPFVPHLIESTTSYPIAPLTDGTRYYFKVALLDGNNRVSAKSAEVSAVPGVGAVGGTGPSGSASTGGGSGGGSNNSKGHDAGSIPGHTSSSSHTGLIILLAGVSVAATGGAIAIVATQRRRRGGRYAPVPAPRRPYDDQPAGPSNRVPASRVEELNGPRYR
jgi:Fibronectin type III domain